MDITGFGQTTAPSNAQGSSSLASLTDNFDHFLLLLTKQLQYQDPLSPMDTNEFTSQLVQFTSVEQAINTNSKLEQLIGLQSNGQALGALAFLNKTVEVGTDQFALSDGAGEIKYELPKDASKTVIAILDSSGKLVRTIEQGAMSAGEHSLTWDGKDNDGVALPDGIYSVEVAAADDNNEIFEVATKTVGQVKGVRMENGEIILDLDGIEVSANQVRSVRDSSSGT